MAFEWQRRMEHAHFGRATPTGARDARFGSLNSFARDEMTTVRTVRTGGLRWKLGHSDWYIAPRGRLPRWRVRTAAGRHERCQFDYIGRGMRMERIGGRACATVERIGSIFSRPGISHSGGGKYALSCFPPMPVSRVSSFREMRTVFYERTPPSQIDDGRALLARQPHHKTSLTFPSKIRK